MFDLGRTFLQSVERRPHRLAIVDGDVRLTYAQWYERIRCVAGALASHGLGRGDHLAVVLQNRWEMATLHWACQFLGVIVTPVNWRAKGDELEYCVRDAAARAIAFEPVSAEAVREAPTCAGIPRIAVGGAPGGTHEFGQLLAGTPLGATFLRHGRGHLADALHLRHHRPAQGRAAPPSRRARGGRRAGRAIQLCGRRSDARRDAAVPHHGRAVALVDGDRRRDPGVPAALRGRRCAAADRRGKGDQPFPRADALSRPARASRIRRSPTFRRSPRSGSRARR